MNTFLLDKLAHLCGLYDYIHQIQYAHNRVCGDLQDERRKIAALKREKEELTTKLFNAEKEQECLFDKCDSMSKQIADMKAHFDDEVKIMASNHEADMKYLRDRNQELKSKLNTVNGKLGAYIKKHGELPHKRENQRKRKQNETTQNPATD